MTAARVPVLVVDDNEEFLRVARAVLDGSTPPFAVHTAETGTEALAFLERRPPFTDAPRPAFVVLDFHLPDLSAPTVLGRLRRHPQLRDIPVLVVSAAGWTEDESAARAAGACEFRVKPSRVHAIAQTVVAFWEEHVHAGHHPGR
jgi:CheY-like chemotaxis protein